MNKILVELHYLPSTAYFSLLQSVDYVLIESQEHFVKQSFRNRTVIHDANKALSLSIPIKHTALKIPSREVQIDYSQKWVNTHWRAIKSSYGKAPFFDYYAEYFKSALYNKEPFLYSLNMKLLTLCLKLLGVRVNIESTTTYQQAPSDGLLDMRSQLSPKTSSENLSWFHAKPYYQLFGKDFVSNLSILDLLFCTGPDASTILKESFLGLENK